MTIARPPPTPAGPSPALAPNGSKRRDLSLAGKSWEWLDMQLECE